MGMNAQGVDSESLRMEMRILKDFVIETRKKPVLLVFNCCSRDVFILDAR